MPDQKPNRKIKVYKRCCVPGCLNRTSISTGVHFFKFPCNRKNKSIFQNWCLNVRVDSTTLNTFSMVCSDHFLPQFLTYGKTKVNLRRGAVPTVNLPLPHTIIANSTLSSSCKNQNPSEGRKIKCRNDLFENKYNFDEYIKCSCNQIETDNKIGNDKRSNNLYCNDTSDDASVERCSSGESVNSMQQISKNNQNNFSHINNYKTKVFIVAQKDLDTKLFNLNAGNKFTRIKQHISHEFNFCNDETYERSENYEKIADNETAHMHEEVIDINSDISDNDIECLDCIEDCECYKNKKKYKSWMDENDLPAEYLDDALYEMTTKQDDNVHHFNESTTTIYKNDAADFIETEMNGQNQNYMKNKYFCEYDVDAELQRIEDTLKVLQQRKSLLKNEKNLMKHKQRTIKQIF